MIYVQFFLMTLFGWVLIRHALDMLSPFFLLTHFGKQVKSLRISDHHIQIFILFCFDTVIRVIRTRREHNILIDRK